MLKSLFNKVAGLQGPTQMFSYEIYIRTKFYNRTPLVATSGASDFGDNSTFHNSRKFSRVHVFAGMLLNRKTH